jgi:hypothetical protein
MERQAMDWHYMFLGLAWILHWQRSSLQLYRTVRIQQIAERNITLLEILSDPRAALLFEKHLIGGKLEFCLLMIASELTQRPVNRIGKRKPTILARGPQVQA